MAMTGMAGSLNRHGLKILAGMAATLALSGSVVFGNDAATPRRIRVACVGDSITMGVGTATPATQSFPAQAQAMLGDGWELINFGVGGRTLLRKADPLAFGRALRSEPDVVLIMLGVNDSKTNSWAIHKSDFVSDYIAAIREFQALPSRPVVMACLPTPAFPGNWGISGAVIADEIVPGIREAVKATGAVLVDTHTPLLDAKVLFPDKVHPNAEGARRIAGVVAAALLEVRKGDSPEAIERSKP